MVATIAAMASERGIQTTILIPGYPSLTRAVTVERLVEIGPLLGAPCRLVLARQGMLRLVVIQCDELFGRPGGIYTDPNSKPWDDNAIRFAVLGKVASIIANGRTPVPPPNIVHLHDWHSGFYFAFDPPPRVRSVLTVHNFAFHGRFDRKWLERLCPFADMRVLKAGLLFDGYSPLTIGADRADILTTVSEGYRRELQNPTRHDWFQLSERNRQRLVAIPNWADRATWDPANDPSIAQPFDVNKLPFRDINRAHLAAELGLRPDLPIICTVSRITAPKGFKFLLNNLSVLIPAMNLIIIGEGDAKLMSRARHAAAQWPTHIRFVTPYNETVARRALAGADFLLMPSLVEPCGLTQMHAQAYGCVPIASMTGGLTASVGDAGFLFRPSNRASFKEAVCRAMSLFADRSEWRALQIKCMNNRANELAGPNGYLDCYEGLVRRGPKGSGSLRGHLSSDAGGKRNATPALVGRGAERGR